MSFANLNFRLFFLCAGRIHPEHERKATIPKDENVGNEQSGASSEEGHIGQSQQQRVPLSQHNQQVPSVYLRGELYKQRREVRMKVLEQKEREQRKFHAKPAPNFTAIHAVHAHKRTQEEPKITVPITPRVVHSHRRFYGLAKAKVSITFSYMSC